MGVVAVVRMGSCRNSGGLLRTPTILFFISEFFRVTYTNNNKMGKRVKRRVKKKSIKFRELKVIELIVQISSCLFICFITGIYEENS